MPEPFKANGLDLFETRNLWLLVSTYINYINVLLKCIIQVDPVHVVQVVLFIADDHGMKPRYGIEWLTHLVVASFLCRL